jgi:hypothetical protein
VSSPFVPGRELSRRLYTDAVRPLLDDRFGKLPHAAAHVGPGSDVLGRDTPVSRDHDWGPAVTVFLGADAGGQVAAVRALLLDRLPATFGGSPLGAQRVTTVRAYARERLGIDPAEPLTADRWLSFPSQTLLELTGGLVHHDGPGEVTALRERLRWYPDDVWRYLLAAGWTRLGQEEHLMGRAGYVGDELGSALIAGRLARDLMHLGFLMERRYAPYPKWFGTAFARLACAPALTPLLCELVAAQEWPQRQDTYAAAASLLLRRHNELGLAGPADPRPRPFHSRPFWVIDGDRVAAALVDAVTDPAVRRLTTRRVIGGVDQWSDSTDLRDPSWRPQVLRFYG